MIFNTKKFCIDCKHITQQRETGCFECGHPKALSVVDGKPHELCVIMRGRYSSTACGPEGRWFEAKQ